MDQNQQHGLALPPNGSGGATHPSRPTAGPSVSTPHQSNNNIPPATHPGMSGLENTYFSQAADLQYGDEWATLEDANDNASVHHQHSHASDEFLSADLSSAQMSAILNSLDEEELLNLPELDDEGNVGIHAGFAEESASQAVPRASFGDTQAMEASFDGGFEVPIGFVAADDHAHLGVGAGLETVRSAEQLLTTPSLNVNPDLAHPQYPFQRQAANAPEPPHDTNDDDDDAESTHDEDHYGAPHEPRGKYSDPARQCDHSVTCPRPADYRPGRYDGKKLCHRHGEQWDTRHSPHPQWTPRVMETNMAIAMIRPNFQPPLRYRMPDPTLEQHKNGLDDWTVRFHHAAMAPYRGEEGGTDPYRLLAHQTTFAQRARGRRDKDYREDKIQARISLLFPIARRYHEGGPAIYCDGGDNGGYRANNDLNFLERLEAVEGVLKTNKKVVMDVIEGRGVEAFVRGPVDFDKRKKTNKKTNITRARKQARARAEDAEDDGAPSAAIDEPASTSRARRTDDGASRNIASSSAGPSARKRKHAPPKDNGEIANRSPAPMPPPNRRRAARRGSGVPYPSYIPPFAMMRDGSTEEDRNYPTEVQNQSAPHGMSNVQDAGLTFSQQFLPPGQNYAQPPHHQVPANNQTNAPRAGLPQPVQPGAFNPAFAHQPTVNPRHLLPPGFGGPAHLYVPQHPQNPNFGQQVTQAQPHAQQQLPQQLAPQSQGLYEAEDAAWMESGASWSQTPFGGERPNAPLQSSNNAAMSYTRAAPQPQNQTAQQHLQSERQQHGNGGDWQ